MRHKNDHGDINFNSRLKKFGLIDSESCNNCGHQQEIIAHKLIECPAAREAWAKLAVVKSRLSGID